MTLHIAGVSKFIALSQRESRRGLNKRRLNEGEVFIVAVCGRISEKLGVGYSVLRIVAEQALENYSTKKKISKPTTKRLLREREPSFRRSFIAPAKSDSGRRGPTAENDKGALVADFHNHLVGG